MDIYKSARWQCSWSSARQTIGVIVARFAVGRRADRRAGSAGAASSMPLAKAVSLPIIALWASRWASFGVCVGVGWW